MTIVSSLINPVVDRTIILRSIISRSIKNLITRNFLNFDPVAQTYGELLEPYVYPAEFSVSYTVVGSDISRDQALEDSSKFNSIDYDGYVLIYIDNPDGATLIIGNNGDGGFKRYTFGFQTEILNGDSNVITFERDINNTIRLFVNGEQKGNEETHDGNITFEGHLGGGNGRYLNGNLLDVSYSNPVDVNLEPDFYAIATSNDYEISSLAGLGEEIIVSGDNINSSSIKNILPAGSYGVPVVVTGGLSAALKYHDDVGVISFTSDNQMISSREGGNGVLNLYNATASTIDLSPVSVKKLTGNALLLNNVDHSETELYKLSSDGTQWLSTESEKVINVTPQSDPELYPNSAFLQDGSINCNGTAYCGQPVPCGE